MQSRLKCFSINRRTSCPRRMFLWVFQSVAGFCFVSRSKEYGYTLKSMQIFKVCRKNNICEHDLWLTVSFKRLVIFIANLLTVCNSSLIILVYSCVLESITKSFWFCIFSSQNNVYEQVLKIFCVSLWCFPCNRSCISPKVMIFIDNTFMNVLLFCIHLLNEACYFSPISHASSEKWCQYFTSRLCHCHCEVISSNGYQPCFQRT